MVKRGLLLFLVLVAAFLVVGCNAYMTKDTAEFNAVTGNFIGAWDVTASNAEGLGTVGGGAEFTVDDMGAGAVKFTSGGKVTRTATWEVDSFGKSITIDGRAYSFTFFNYNQAVAVYDTSGKVLVSMRMVKTR